MQSKLCECSYQDRRIWARRRWVRTDYWMWIRCVKLHSTKLKSRRRVNKLFHWVWRIAVRMRCPCRTSRLCGRWRDRAKCERYRRACWYETGERAAAELASTDDLQRRHCWTLNREKKRKQDTRFSTFRICTIQKRNEFWTWTKEKSLCISTATSMLYGIKCQLLQLSPPLIFYKPHHLFSYSFVMTLLWWWWWWWSTSCTC